MPGINSEHSIKGKLMLRGAIKHYCEEVSHLKSFDIHQGDAVWGKRVFRTAIKSLYYALKTYSNSELEKRLMRRVKCFKWRMLFMRDNAVEYEAHELARELEKYLES